MSPVEHDTDVDVPAYQDDADPLYLASENRLLRARVAGLESRLSQSGWAILCLSLVAFVASVVR
jgi:hypothetical protein